MCELRLDCWFRTRIVEQTRNDVPGTLDRSLARNRAISAAVYQRPMCGISGHVGFAHSERYFDDLTDRVVDIVSVPCQPAAHLQQLAQGVHRAGVASASEASTACLNCAGLIDAALDDRGMSCSLRSSARLQERSLRLPLWQKRQTCPPVDHPYSVRLRTGSYASPRCDLPALGYI